MIVTIGGNRVSVQVQSSGIARASAAVIAAVAAEDAAQAAQATAQAAQTGAETARDAAQGYASDAAGASGFVDVSSRAGLAGLTLPAAIKQIATRGYATEGDGGGADYVRTSYATITAGAYPAASYTRSVDRIMPDGSTDATNGGYWLLSGATTGRIDATQLGAVMDGSTQTSTVQAALDTLPDTGTLIIPTNIKFSLKGLTFPPRCNMEYRVDDDVDSPGAASNIGSGERVQFSSCSSYPADPTGGTVNERRFTAPYHPGHIIDIRSDVPGGDAGLSASQSRTNPVRGSYNIAHQEVGVWRNIFEQASSYSIFNGVFNHTWRRTVALNGIGTAQWTSVPTVNTLITGTTSGATGSVISVAAGATTVLWISGKFVAGETVSDDNETTTATVTSVTSTATQSPSLTQDMKRGHISIGLPPGSPTHLFAVGGKIGATATRTSGQHVETTITNPGYCWVDNYEAATPAGFEVITDVSVAAASRRLYLTRLDSTVKIAQVGAVGLYTNFNNSVAAITSGYNATNTRTTTGDYTATATVPFTRADFTVAMTKEDAGDNPYLFIRSTTTARVKNDDRNYIWSGTATYDPPSLADGVGVNTTVTVTGVSASAQCWATFSVALSGLEIRAWYSAANTITVRFQNNTGGVVDLASGTLTAYGRGSGAAKDIAGRVHLVCVGGDI